MYLTIIAYVLKAALRDRLMLGLAVATILGACLSVLSSSFAIIEQDQFVIAYMAGGLRILALVALSLFTIFFVRRSFDSRDVEFLLTRPLSRASFVIAHAAAFSILALGAGVLLTVIVGAAALHKGMTGGIMLWSLGITFEYIIVVNTAFFFAMILTSPVTAGLATFGFYVLCRLMGQFLAIMGVAGSGGPLHNVMEGAVKLISLATPRLDLLAQTSWLIYGGEKIEDWIFVPVQGVVFTALVVAATYLDLKRRQF
ncbi:MAG: hypothetical protein WC043_03235 [Pseudobdellovibrionaceae bacterium]